MQSASTTIRNKTGLHARPASDFVAAAKGYASKVTIRATDEAEDTAVSAKSIVAILRFKRVFIVGLKKGRPSGAPFPRPAPGSEPGRAGAVARLRGARKRQDNRLVTFFPLHGGAFPLGGLRLRGRVLRVHGDLPHWFDRRNVVRVELTTLPS